MAEYYKTLKETGICVIPITNDIAKIHGIHSKYMKMIETLPSSDIPYLPVIGQQLVPEAAP